MFKGELHRLLVLALFLGFAASPLLAQSPDASTAIDSARELEKARRWEEAAQAYLRAWALDRTNTQTHENMVRCLRLAFQSQRHREPALLARILAMTPAEALTLYGEVLTKLQTYYVDPERVSTARLFRQGLEEYIAALNEPPFIERHLKGSDDIAIARFRANLRKAWIGRDVSTPRQAVELVAEIGTATRRSLNMRTINPVVAEFICGACNSLDEYSSYLSSSQFSAETTEPLVRSVEVRPHEGDVVTLRILQFHSDTPREVQESLKPFLMMRQIRALIIDLRGNSGGSLTAAIKTAEKFLPGGIIVSAQGPNDEVNKVYTSVSGSAALDLPLIVLVDRDTASAAEVLAIALRDNRRAKLIGTSTFGKGSVQNVVKFTTAEELDMTSGKPVPRAAIRITLARLIGPSGSPISGVGVTPDEIVADRDRQDDLALEQARELARRYMSGIPVMRP